VRLTISYRYLFDVQSLFEGITTLTEVRQMLKDLGSRKIPYFTLDINRCSLLFSLKSWTYRAINISEHLKGKSFYFLSLIISQVIIDLLITLKLNKM